MLYGFQGAYAIYLETYNSVPAAGVAKPAVQNNMFCDISTLIDLIGNLLLDSLGIITDKWFLKLWLQVSRQRLWPYQPKIR